MDCKCPDCAIKAGQDFARRVIEADAKPPLLDYADESESWIDGEEGDDEPLDIESFRLEVKAGTVSMNVYRDDSLAYDVTIWPFAVSGAGNTAREAVEDALGSVYSFVRYIFDEAGSETVSPWRNLQEVFDRVAANGGFEQWFTDLNASVLQWMEAYEAGGAK